MKKKKFLKIWDKFDAQAKRDADAIREAREYQLDRPATKAKMKGMVARGSSGAKSRYGLVRV